jgi:hypothetical protein
MIALAASFGCGETPRVVGPVGAACVGDHNCLDGLVCASGRCASIAPDGGRPPDAGLIEDAGRPDAGDPRDTGVPDTGPVCPVPPELARIQSDIFGANGQPSCNQAACHGQGAAGGIQLTLPVAQLRQALLGDTRDPGAPERKLVVPGDPAASRLYTLVSTRAPAGTGLPMPPSAMLSACDVETIRTWIENGAP